MLESLIGTFNAVKQATPTVLLGIAIATAALLSLPAGIVSTLGLDTLLRDHRQYLGAGLVGSIAILLAQALVAFTAFAKSLYAKRKAKQSAALAEQRRIDVLATLTPEEKAYLVPYIGDEKNTQYWSIQDGIAGGLQAKGVIYQAANVGDMNSGFAFNLQSWARDHLHRNPQLLEGARAPERRSRW